MDAHVDFINDDYNGVSRAIPSQLLLYRRTVTGLCCERLVADLEVSRDAIVYLMSLSSALEVFWLKTKNQGRLWAYRGAEIAVVHNAGVDNDGVDFTELSRAAALLSCIAARNDSSSHERRLSFVIIMFYYSVMAAAILKAILNSVQITEQLLLSPTQARSFFGSYWTNWRGSE